MPQLIESPESWLRDNKRDLHVIEVEVRACANDFLKSEYVCPVSKNGLPKILDDWLRNELPLVQTGIIGPSESSGWIQGGPRSPFIDFDAEGLARYIAEWEDDRQRATNAGFKRVTDDYSQWRSQLSHCKIFQSPPESPQDCWWWDTPIGLLWSPLRFNKEGKAYSSASSYRDLWLRAQELHPALSGLSVDDIVVGKMRFHNKSLGWHCTVLLPLFQEGKFKGIYVGERKDERPSKHQPRTPRQQEICELLGLGHETVIFVDDFML